MHVNFAQLYYFRERKQIKNRTKVHLHEVDEREQQDCTANSDKNKRRAIMSIMLEQK